jgi:hypothetical protein
MPRAGLIQFGARFRTILASALSLQVDAVAAYKSIIQAQQDSLQIKR